MAEDSRKQSKAEQEKRDYYWIWVIIGFIVVGGYYFWQRQASQVFNFVEGDDRPMMVLVRSSEEAYYKVQYVGRKQIAVSRVQLKLVTGPEMKLYTDVEAMSLSGPGGQVVLDKKGNVLEGDSFTLAPQDEFEIRIVVYGREVGGNPLKSLLFSYIPEGRSEAVVFEMPLSNAFFTVE
jgi:hypothetical protein